MKSALSSESTEDLRAARRLLLRWLADPTDMIHNPQWLGLGYADVIGEETLILLELRARGLQE